MSNIHSNNKRWGIALYNMLMAAAVCVGLPVILPTVLLYEKRRKSVLHRLGILPAETRENLTHIRKAGRMPIWLHALSVGEIFSAVPVAEAFAERFRGVPIVFSTTTRTGYDLALSRMKGLVKTVFYFPFDFSFVVRRSIDRIRPCAIVMVETDLWPNMLFLARRCGIPVVLLNGRVSRKSYKGYRRFSFLTRPMFASLSRVCAQSESDARRFERLGVPRSRISITGSTKFDPPHTRRRMEDKLPAKARLGLDTSRKLMVAGSTHEGEEDTLKNVLIRLKKAAVSVSLIVAPRDPGRALAVKRLFEASGFTVGLATEAEETKGLLKDVIVVDGIGRLKQLYGLADFAFVGGSLVEKGGHNPLEPALFAVPVLFGPHMSDFQEIAFRLLQSGGAIQVTGERPLFDAAVSLAGDSERARRIGAAAAATLEANRGALQKSVDSIFEFIRPEGK